MRRRVFLIKCSLISLFFFGVKEEFFTKRLLVYYFCPVCSGRAMAENFFMASCISGTGSPVQESLPGRKGMEEPLWVLIVAFMITPF